MFYCEQLTAQLFDNDAVLAAIYMPHQVKGLS